MRNIKFTLMLCMILYLFRSVSLAQDSLEPIASVELDTQIYSLSWQSNSEYFAVGTLDGIKIYTPLLDEVVSLHSGERILNVNWHPFEARLAITYSASVEIWDWDTESHNLNLINVIDLETYTIHASWNTDGSQLMIVRAFPASEYQSGFDIGEISLWNGDDFQQLLTIPKKYPFYDPGLYTNLIEWSPNNSNQIVGFGSELEILPDGNILALTNAIIYVYDASTGVRTHAIEVGDANYGYSVAAQPNGEYVAVGQELASLIFDLSTGQFVTGAVGNHFDIFSLAWSPDGRYLASEQSLFDIQKNFERITTTHVGNGDVRAVEWSPDGKHLLLADSQGYLVNVDVSFLE